MCIGWFSKGFVIVDVQIPWDQQEYGTIKSFKQLHVHFHVLYVIIDFVLRPWDKKGG